LVGALFFECTKVSSSPWLTLVGHGQNPVHVPARKEWGDKGTMIDDV
jgi:hypothetical protein